MSKKWSQAFASNPRSVLQAADLLAIAVSDGAGGYLAQANAGEWGVLTNRYTAIHVNDKGSDTAGIGNGSLLCPYKTVQGAMTAITDASITKQYVLHMTGALTDATATLKPFIHLFSDGSPWYVGTVNLDASFQTASNFWMKYQNISIASACTLTLTFTDPPEVFGYLEFINFNPTRVGSSATPAIDFIMNSPVQAHQHIFTNCNFSEFNDNGSVSFHGVASSQALVSITGGTLPATIDFSQSFVQGTLQIANTNINNCIITAGGSGCVLYLSGINVNKLNNPSIVSVGSNTFIYDASIANTSIFNLTGDLGSTFQLLTEGSVIFPNYSPANYTVPNPGVFKNTKTLYDHFNGIDNKLAAYLYSGTDMTIGNGNALVQRTASGTLVGYFATNLSNTANSSAAYGVAVAGSSAGDAYTYWSVAGGGVYAAGVDNSDSDKFKRTTGTGDLSAGYYEVVTQDGAITQPLQPAFLAYLATTVTNKTGNGASYTLGTDALTILYDQASNFNTNGTFTASVTGIFDLKAQVTIGATTIATSFVVSIVTTTKTYTKTFSRAALAANQSVDLNVLAPMTATNTATVTVVANGEAANTDSIVGSATIQTFFCGKLAC